MCRDFLTGELYYLSFPLTGTDPLEDRVFLGHVFYNRSMGMNWLQSYTLKPLARKRLLEVLEACRDWYDVQFPGADWGEFLSRQALVCREVLRKVSKNPAACRFPYETRHRDYVPGPLPEKMTPVEKMVQEIVLVSGRGEYDIRLIRHMWADFKDLCPHTGLYEPPGVGRGPGGEFPGNQRQTGRPAETVPAGDLRSPSPGPDPGLYGNPEPAETGTVGPPVSG